MTTLPAVLITGASTGIGEAYAERFARRGHALVLVARDESRLDALAARLHQESGVRADVLRADLTRDDDLLAVEARLRGDARIGILINNAGVGQSASFLDLTPERVDELILLNTRALARLAHAVAPRLVESGGGAIVNIGSVAGFGPEFGRSLYGATKAFALFLSQALAADLVPQGVYVQAVLPGATRTEIWARGGIDVDTVPDVMDVGELVDAALVGFDRREALTIPHLHDEQPWNAFESARRSLITHFRQKYAAPRYKSQAPIPAPADSSF